MLYGWGVALRNFAFDSGLIKSYKCTIPTICVGNLSVGGTGKTPHIEYLLEHLHTQYRVAILTRGYGRKTKAPLFATPTSTAQQIGDEPAQIIRKYPNTMILVDANRVRALRRLEMLPPDVRPQVVLMDDGFQHRYVKPAYSILLTPYQLPFTRDALMPYGTLREPASSRYRADTIIVTGTPYGLLPINFRLLVGEMDLLDNQDLFFSRIAYAAPKPLFPQPEAPPLSAASVVLPLAGIARPEAFLEHVQQQYPNAQPPIVYPDHYTFNSEDIRQLCHRLQQHPEWYLLCTEKDGMRLLDKAPEIPAALHNRIYTLPIHIFMSPETSRRFMARVQLAIHKNGLTMV